MDSTAIGHASRRGTLLFGHTDMAVATTKVGSTGDESITRHPRSLIQRASPQAEDSAVAGKDIRPIPFDWNDSPSKAAALERLPPRRQARFQAAKRPCAAFGQAERQPVRGAPAGPPGRQFPSRPRPVLCPLRSAPETSSGPLAGPPQV